MQEPNQEVAVNSILLSANNPASGSGSWTKIAGDGNIIFDDNYRSLLTNVQTNVYGVYTLRWTIQMVLAPALMT
jgi:hypothetical protein